MDTSKLKKFAQFARRNLIEQVQSKLKLVLADESVARREHPKAVKDLEQKLNHHSDQKESEEQLIEKVAYTWFNRFCALRFMDVNQYNRIMVLSPISGQFQPEILAEAKAGHLDDTVFNDKAREKIQGLLSGSVPSRDGQAEAYRMMIVAVCNDYYQLMPYLFERIEDYTELLMPDDLLSGNSILAYTREAMTPENCESVESIGWLYQFYISEKKDLVFADLKKNKKITPENIPAATQLFTPHWIVKYLVENSLGRLWMLNNPNSKVIEQMEYYIKPVEDEADFLKVGSPEELKVCDNACGSGHMLTYAYDLLYAIYLDANYDPIEIPELILTKNLYGIEIDERAAELAAFALSMKALKGNPLDRSNNRRRFFRNPIEPNICRLEKVKIDDEALDEYMDFIGRDLFTQDLRATLTEFEEADNFGSLIQPTLTNVPDILEIIEAKDAKIDFFLADTHKSVLKVLKQAKYLSPIYHALITNPPYLGAKGMNPRMTSWLKDKYTDVRTDLFSAFIVRNINMTLPKGQLGFMTPFVWMFISSYEKLRNHLINTKTITSLIQLEYSGFDGATVPICTFTLENSYRPEYEGGYVRLSDFKGAKNQGPKALEAIKEHSKSWFYRATSTDFNKVPGNPIAYWVDSKFLEIFNRATAIHDIAPPRIGMMTTDNARFLRYWFEVDYLKIGFKHESIENAQESSTKWFPYNKGGNYRKWAGNCELVVNWFKGGKEIQEAGMTSFRGKNFYFKAGVTWGDISSAVFSCRYTSIGKAFDIKGTSCFPSAQDTPIIMSVLNSKVGTYILKFLNPTISFQSGDIRRVPIPYSEIQNEINPQDVNKLINHVQSDWDAFEGSFDFTQSPIIKFKESGSFSNIYRMVKNNWDMVISEIKRIEENINRSLIDAYSLDNELEPSIQMKEITVNCNPFYRYNGQKDKSELEQMLLRDTVIEYLSYSVGCMFGRYSLDKTGLIIANHGDTLENYLKQVPSPSFIPDEDNVIPIIDFEGDWFEDDITERFKSFLKVTLGEENFSVNITFIEAAIGKDIKKYFVKDFYADHVKRYKKRPIYWMFSSPKGSFNVLIYMHRYQPDTASIVLNDYLREFRTKLEARKESYEQVEISVSASQKDITQAIKAIAKINKVLEEVNDYEHDVLYPLAGKKQPIDLDDGVKHNYPLFGKALKKVTGLS
jgi:type II restriction/modification system DNA methylase subunit YeeA